jgi:hypothetical protein
VYNLLDNASKEVHKQICRAECENYAEIDFSKRSQFTALLKQMPEKTIACNCHGADSMDLRSVDSTVNAGFLFFMQNTSFEEATSTKRLQPRYNRLFPTFHPPSQQRSEYLFAE